MRRHPILYLLFLTAGLLSLVLGACQAKSPANAPPGALQTLAVESFLADITQNVAGERLKVESLIPPGVDPHAFEPSTRDVTRLSDSQAIIINGAGLETWLEKIMVNVNPATLVIEASGGLAARQPQAAEMPVDEAEGDPHFWLDPNLVIQYVENIRRGLTQVDPAGASQYQANAQDYTQKLKELDNWIKGQVALIPAERRLLVTNHENFGYFADRYGFKIIGTILPGVSTGASPSAQELAALMQRIREAHAPAIFLESGVNPQLANQIADETGVKVITNLYTHSVTAAGGDAPSYIAMMKHNVQLIVDGLK